ETMGRFCFIVAIHKAGRCMHGLIKPFGPVFESTGRVILSLNFSQFVEGRSGCTRARVDLEKARPFARNEREDGEKIHHFSARFSARQSVTNCATQGCEA